MKSLLLLMIGASAILLSPVPCLADSPDCDGPNNWAAAMAHAKLKNEHLLKNEEVDFEKTTVLRLASEKIGDDLYRQVHYVVYFLKAGGTIESITVNDASNEECSMGSVDVYVVDRKLGK